jgi:hypothetical protein
MKALIENSPIPLEVAHPELGALLQWYVEGHDRGELPSFDEVKKDFWDVGRNDPCPGCAIEGITIKFKKCHKHNREIL